MTVEITYATPIPIKSIKATCIYDADDRIVASPRMDDDGAPRVLQVCLSPSDAIAFAKALIEMISVTEDTSNV